MADLTFKVPKRNTEPVTFDLEGDKREYVFTPPKQADMVLPMLESENDLGAAKAAFAWLDEGLSKEDSDHITARLKNKDDDLDIDAIEEVVTGLVEHVSARPTT